ncbi:MAG: tRNA pseudouridine(54/55) synthase Pus10 [Candidatus Methanoplasma sp.]|jgi:tRNA pseudouridine synthase 10|nr:tRNA pseudouridine(54/55) synthase Pus10 [Candidatus Methanoplasma sp.]
MDGFEERIREAASAAPGLAGESLCDRCLGRMFGKIGSGLSNAERGAIARLAIGGSAPPGPCPLCDGAFDMLDRLAEAAAEELGGVESDNFLIGSKTGPEAAAMEKDLWERHALAEAEGIKSELNREIGKIVARMTGRVPEFKNPQVVACVDARFADVSLDIAPLFIAGRYTKLSREIPQTIWPCRACRGKGCGRCGGTGKMYQTSVQEIIGDIALEMTGGEEHFFHGMGREDIDARMLGDGRPFILEVSRPRVRKIDLGELERAANASDMAGYSRLRFAERGEVQIYKGSDPDKTYRARVRTDGKVNKERANEVALAFSNVQIDQRTPRRVEHRRADLVRKRTIRWVEAEMTGDDTLDLTLSTESGTYVKEFVSGDEGRTRPSFSEALGVGCVVEELDVLSIDYQEPKRD